MRKYCYPPVEAEKQPSNQSANTASSASSRTTHSERTIPHSQVAPRSHDVALHSHEDEAPVAVKRFLAGDTAQLSLKRRLTRCMLECNPIKVQEVDFIVDKMHEAGASEVTLFAKLCVKYQGFKSQQLRRELHNALVAYDLLDWLILALQDDRLRAVSEREGLVPVLRDGVVLCRLAKISYFDGSGKRCEPEQNAPVLAASLLEGKQYFYAMDNVCRFLEFCWSTLGLGEPSAPLFDVGDLVDALNEDIVLHRMQWVACRMFEIRLLSVPPPLSALHDRIFFNESENARKSALFSMYECADPSMGIALLRSTVPSGCLTTCVYEYDKSSNRHFMILSHPFEHPAHLRIHVCVIQRCIVAKMGPMWELIGSILARHIKQWDGCDWTYPHLDFASEQVVDEVANGSMTGVPEAVKVVHPSPTRLSRPSSKSCVARLVGGQGSPEQSTPGMSKVRRNMAPPPIALPAQLEVPPSVPRRSEVKQSPIVTSSAAASAADEAPEALRSSFSQYFSDEITDSDAYDIVICPLTDAESAIPPTPCQSPAPRTIRIVPNAAGALIGRGSYGSVFVGLDMDQGVTVAVKVVPILSDSDPQKVEQVKREVALISHVSHKNVVRCFGAAFTDTRCMCIAMEYATSGTLLGLISRFFPISTKLATKFICEIAAGLLHLHQCGIIHCDLKPGNILVRSDGSVAIADFGCSKAVASVACGSKLVGTPAYMAPEVVMREAYSLKSDVWAFGCCIVELCTGKVPWSHLELGVVPLLYRIGNCHDEIPYADSDVAQLDKDIQSIVRLAFISDPEARPDMRHLMKDFSPML